MSTKRLLFTEKELNVLKQQWALQLPTVAALLMDDEGINRVENAAEDALDLYTMLCYVAEGYQVQEVEE